jgi:hypothetical protein
VRRLLGGGMFFREGIIEREAVGAGIIERKMLEDK